MVGRHVEQTGYGGERSRLLVLAAERRRTDALRVDVRTVVLGGVLRHHQGPAVGFGVLVHVDLGRPVDLRIVLLGHQQLAGDAVERIAEAVAIEVNQDLAGCAADVLIGENHLVDAIKVPLVVRRHLIDPFGHPGIGVACPNGH